MLRHSLMRWFLILMLTLAGCAAPTADWYGDARFTSAERSRIEEGVTWLATSAGKPVPTIDWSYEVTSSDPLHRTIRRERGFTDTNGMCDLNATTIYLDVDDPWLPVDMQPGLAAHEMAHCWLGLADDADTDGIMRVLSPMVWSEREQHQTMVVPK